MKVALPALLAATLLLAPALRAQDAVPAESQTEPIPQANPALDLMPAQPEPLLPPSAAEPTLLPEAPTTNKKPRGTALDQPKAKKEKTNTTEAAENALQARVRYRLAKTRAMRDPAILAEWKSAEAARTDFDKRAALKRFYKLLYARMLKLDRTLKPEIALRETVSFRRLEQTRVDPTTGRLDLGDDRTARLDQE